MKILVACEESQAASKIINSDALTALQALPSSSANTMVTSPPYYMQRDYGVIGQIGLEATVEEYINNLVAIFREAKRVLRDDGTLWVNIADSYSGSGKGSANYPDNAKKYKQGTNRGMLGSYIKSTASTICKPKELMLIPFELAKALRNDGWYLRQDIIWDKPNAMPESVTDRCTKSHEYIFLLSKSKRYYFDYEAIKEPCVGFNKSSPRGSKGTFTENSGRRKGNNKSFRGGGAYTNNCAFDNSIDNTKETIGNTPSDTGLRRKRSVWRVATKGLKNSSVSHFATFPAELIKPCILAGCPTGGVVLDMFAGSGTVGVVAKETGRKYILIELNPAYVGLIEERLITDA